MAMLSLSLSLDFVISLFFFSVALDVAYDHFFAFIPKSKQRDSKVCKHVEWPIEVSFTAFMSWLVILFGNIGEGI